MRCNRAAPPGTKESFLPGTSFAPLISPRNSRRGKAHIGHRSQKPNGREGFPVSLEIDKPELSESMLAADWGRRELFLCFFQLAHRFRRFRVADLVCFEGAQVVLLRRRRGADGQDSPEQTRGPEQGCRFAFHGCFSSGGAAGLTGAGRRGKSSRIISSSMVIKSWRTS